VLHGFRVRVPTGPGSDRCGRAFPTDVPVGSAGSAGDRLVRQTTMTIHKAIALAHAGRSRASPPLDPVRRRSNHEKHEITRKKPGRGPSDHDSRIAFRVSWHFVFFVVAPMVPALRPWSSPFVVCRLTGESGRRSVPTDRRVGSGRHRPERDRHHPPGYRGPGSPRRFLVESRLMLGGLGR
jgi:hypothetical protein